MPRLAMKQAEPWSDEERGYYLLVNSLTREEWDQNLADVLRQGCDPSKIEGFNPEHRETLPTDAEWDQQFANKAAVQNEKLIA